MSKKRKKLSAGTITSIITAALFILSAVALLIINVYIPVKYLGSYLFAGSDDRQGNADVTFIDVGYGTSIVVRFPDGKNMVIDGGDGSYANRCKIIKALNAMDIDYIDWLVCSTVNGEHCGGLAEIVKYKEIGTIYYPYCVNTYVTEEYRAFYVEALKSGALMTVYEYGVGFAGEGYFFSFLSPTAHTSDGGEYADLNESQTTETKNAASAVLWVECGKTSFLFCGDATEKVMTKICENYLMFKAVGDAYAPQGSYVVDLESLDVAEGAYHGGAASEAFYACTLPKYTIISVGDNTSGNPTTAALSTICNYGEAYTTRESGTIRIEVYDDDFTIIKEKQ